MRQRWFRDQRSRMVLQRSLMCVHVVRGSCMCESMRDGDGLLGCRLGCLCIRCMHDGSSRIKAPYWPRDAGSGPLLLAS